MIELVLAVLTLAAWWGFLRLLRRGRATTTRELIVNLTADTRKVDEAMRRAAASMRRAAASVRAANEAIK